MSSRAGPRNELVSVILEGSTAFGSRGQINSATTTIGTAYARIETVSGLELILGRQFQTQLSHRVTIPWSTEFRRLTARNAWLERSDGTRLQIAAVDNVNGRNRELILSCREQTT